MDDAVSQPNSLTIFAITVLVSTDVVFTSFSEDSEIGTFERFV
jgi:hypothetical protein